MESLNDLMNDVKVAGDHAFRSLRATRPSPESARQDLQTQADKHASLA